MLLYGNSGHARVAIDCLISQNISVEGIFDDNYLKKGINRYVMLGKYDQIVYPDKELIVTVGDNLKRKNITKTISHDFGKAIHSSAEVSENSLIGAGTVIIHKAILQSNVRIGEHAIINTAASVDHDCIVEDYAHISPNATLCGGVSIGEGTHVGAAAVIIPNIKVGRWCVIGAGTVVIKDVPDFSLVVGNPGRVVRITPKPEFD